MSDAPPPAEYLLDPAVRSVSRRLLESVTDCLDSMAHYSYDAGDGNGAGLPVRRRSLFPPIFRQSQKRGEGLPVYASEAALTAIRDNSRVLCANNEFAIGAIESRQNYCVGDGFRYIVRGKTDAVPKRLVRKAQGVIDRWAEANEVADLELEAVQRADEDGEFFIRTFTRPSGLQTLRFVEPEHVKSPTGNVTDHDSYGVRTVPGDVETPVAYWVVDDPVASPTPTKKPASEVLHFKANVKRSAKRGVPVFYPVEGTLRRCESMLAGMASVADARAKIAMIRTLQNVTSDAAGAMIRNLTAPRAGEAGVENPGRPHNVERYDYGSIITASGGTKYEFPSPNIGASDSVEVLQALLRAAATRVNMPEWMFSALADAKYSNAFVVESPSLKAMRKLQRRVTGAFGSSRRKNCPSLAWRQVRAAVAAGKLPPDALKLLKVECLAPALATRDPQGEASRANQLVQAKLWSRERAMKAVDVDDPAAEVAAINREAAEQATEDGQVQMIQQSFAGGQGGEVGDPFDVGDGDAGGDNGGRPPAPDDEGMGGDGDFGGEER